MTGAEVIAAIRAKHLKANVSDLPADAVLQWQWAWVDAGGGLFGRGPYLKVPLYRNDSGFVRVYAPERLRKRLARDWDGSFQ